MRSSARTLVLSAALVLAPAAASAQVGVDSLVHTITAVDGTARADITVRNETDFPMQVTVEIRDWLVDDDGTHRFLPVGTVEGSCGRRLTATPESLRLDGRVATVVSISYAGAAADRCRAIVFLRTDEPDLDIGTEAVNLVIRTGVKFFVEPRPAGTPPAG
jgi:P pilus assembly chaperone PapD